ncbi:MAG: hypothetical protein HY832_02220 [Candidatus Aenigmarchaeota archaeon]|nr:hypothetical protein [Candidatus Aenigmarchaeota archaeon]
MKYLGIVLGFVLLFSVIGFAVDFVFVSVSHTPANPVPGNNVIISAQTLMPSRQLEIFRSLESGGIPQSILTIPGANPPTIISGSYTHQNAGPGIYYYYARSIDADYVTWYSATQNYIVPGCNNNNVCESVIGENSNICSHDCPVPCSFGQWSNPHPSQCGKWVCTSTQVYETRTASPATCQPTKRCIVDSVTCPLPPPTTCESNQCPNDAIPAVCVPNPNCGEYTDCSWNTPDHYNGGSSLPPGRGGGQVYNNGVTFSNVIKKFGSGSALFDSDTDSLDYTLRNQGGLPTGTLEIWVNPTDRTATRALFEIKSTNQDRIIKSVIILTDGSVKDSNCYSTTGACEWKSVQTAPNLIIPNTWTHVAVSWGPNGQLLYINRALAASNLAETRSGLGGSPSKGICVGSCSSNSAEPSVHGYVDEFRVSGFQETAFNPVCNSPPTFTSLSAPATQAVDPLEGVTFTFFPASSVGTPPEAEQQVRLLCGKTQGSSDLCTGPFAATNPKYCNVYPSQWSTDGQKTISCRLVDSFEIASADKTATISFTIPYPQITFLSPSVGTWVKSDFSVYAYVNQQEDTRLTECKYRIKDSGVITKDWTPFTCSNTDTISIPVTVGAGKNCATTGQTLCAVSILISNSHGKTTSVSRSFSVDLTLPAFVSGFPMVTPTYPTRTDTVSIFAKASDQGSGISYMEFYDISGTTPVLLFNCTLSADQGCSTPPQTYPAGQRFFSVLAHDKAGNTVFGSGSFIVADPPKPPEFLSPASWYKNSFTVSVRLQQPEAGVKLSNCVYQIVDHVNKKSAWIPIVPSCAGFQDVTRPLRVSVPSQCTDGSSTCAVTVTVTDDHGPNGQGKTSSFTHSFSIDTVLSSVTVSHIPTNPVAKESLNISTTATDALSGVKKIDMYVGDTLVKTCTTVFSDCRMPLCSDSTKCKTGEYYVDPGVSHSYHAIAEDNAGNTKQAVGVFSFVEQPPNNQPPHVEPISYTGSCTVGSSITLQCTATDPDNDPLSVHVWAGQCNARVCLRPASWEYLNNAEMTLTTGNVFTKTLSIDQPVGTGIAATCQATDPFGHPSNMGDNFNPLCIVQAASSSPIDECRNLTQSYTLDKDIQANGTCFTIIAHNVVLDGNNHIVLGNTSGMAVNNTGGYKNLTVKNFAGIKNFSVGINASHMTDGTIQNNTIEGSTAESSYGIQLGSGATHNTIITNTIHMIGPAGSAIYLPSAVRNTISFNKLYGSQNTHTPPLLLSYALGNQIEGNTIQSLGSNSVGILVNQSDSNIFLLNTVETTGDHAVGVNLLESKYNEFDRGSIQAHNDVEFFARGLVAVNNNKITKVRFGEKTTITSTAFQDIAIDALPTGPALPAKTVRVGDYLNIINTTATGSLDLLVTYTNDDVAHVEEETLKFHQYNVMESTWGIISSSLNTDQNTIALGQHTTITAPTLLSIFGDEKITPPSNNIKIKLHFPDLDQRIVPPDPSGDPIFVRGMPVRFLVTATIGVIPENCNEKTKTCTASYSISGTSLSSNSMSWDEDEKAFTASPSSSSLTCGSTYDLIVTVSENADPTNRQQETDHFSISCTPVLTVVPSERPVALGAHDLEAFVVTMWNPTDVELTGTFTVTPDGTGTPILASLEYYDSEKNPFGNNDVSVESRSSQTIQIWLKSADRAGRYPLVFTVTEDTEETPPETFEGKGTILIYAESLPEFGLTQVIVLFITAGVVIVWFERKRSVC